MIFWSLFTWENWLFLLTKCVCAYCLYLAYLGYLDLRELRRKRTQDF